MKTYQEQQAFFQDHWTAMKAAAEDGGARGVIDFIQGVEDDLARRVLYLFARQGLVMEDWEGKSFDAYVDVCRAGIDEILQQAARSDDEELRRNRTNLANVLSYNLAADLADCWPGDEAPRERGHYEAGLRASEDCIRWREELENGPAALSMAWWGKGMHQLSLRNAAGATESWRRSLDYAVEAARAEDACTEVSPEGGFAVLLGAGYLGLGEWAQGQDAGRVRYEQAVDAFKAQLEDEARKGDASFGIEQLATVKGRYVDTRPGPA